MYDSLKSSFPLRSWILIGRQKIHSVDIVFFPAYVLLKSVNNKTVPVGVRFIQAGLGGSMYTGYVWQSLSRDFRSFVATRIVKEKRRARLSLRFERLGESPCLRETLR